jgi:hypothetical protein
MIALFALDDGITNGNYNAADILYVIAAVLFLVAAVLLHPRTTADARPYPLNGSVAAIGLGLVALGLFLW